VKGVVRLPIRGLILLIEGYRRFISPMKGPTCRFVPTCSTYAQQALDTHGLMRGSWLATRRICRCHPWGGHGFDPVPLKNAECGVRSAECAQADGRKG